MDVKSTKAADDVTCWNHIRAKLMVWLAGWYKWVIHTSFMMIIIPSLFLTLGVLTIIWNPNLSAESKHHFSWSNQGQNRRHSQESRSCDVYTGRWHHCNFCLQGFPGWSIISQFMLKCPSFPPNRKLIEDNLVSGSIVMIQCNYSLFIVIGYLVEHSISRKASHQAWNQQDHTTPFSNEAFFAQLLADLEHDGPDTGNPFGWPNVGQGGKWRWFHQCAWSWSWIIFHQHLYGATRCHMVSLELWSTWFFRLVFRCYFA